MLAYRRKCQLQSQQKNTNTSTKKWNERQIQKNVNSKNNKTNRKIAEDPPVPVYQIT